MPNFIPDLPILLAFSLAAILLAITPGPDMTLFLGRTLTQGRSAGLMTLAGTIVGTMIHTILVVAGISALLAASPTGFWMLKIIGALYLLWLAYQAIFSRSTFSLETNWAVRQSSTRNFWLGLGVNLLNPKVIIFYITFLPQFVEAADPFAWQKMLFLGLFFSVVSGPLLVGLIFAADRVANTLRNNPKISRGIDYLFAGVFAAFALKILTTQAR